MTMTQPEEDPSLAAISSTPAGLPVPPSAWKGTPGEYYAAMEAAGCAWDGESRAWTWRGTGAAP